MNIRDSDDLSVQTTTCWREQCLETQKYIHNCWTMTKVFQNWNQEWKTPQYDQGSIGLKKNTCSGKFCLVLDKKEVWIS